MAMDREKLQTYFTTHYLSRQEVLFKLPFSVPIESFWPELMNRRKVSATILPLYDTPGKPYWYVLTDKMIAASERLCEEAMDQAEDFDPYRAPMTGAMTEEMFFTSFVEGAQIPLQEAMNFLRRGTEPENVQEQMIWNNRQAWCAMMKGLYRPLDEAFLKGLTFMLTDEMEGRAEDYRQTDSHPIAAMADETYDVPPASVLPERMREYVGFLQRSDVHPLIKASAGQAYLLVARPFQEGNERLSRMVSSAVLLRSGYDYFRDISISGAIARESYRYYKAMCEILRAENGNDLTYFIEYYLELLVRAMDMKKERDMNREKERLEREKAALEAERALAKEPLRNEVREKAESWTAEQAKAETPSNSVPFANGMTSNAPPIMPDAMREGLPEELEQKIRRPPKGFIENEKRRRAGVLIMIKEHRTSVRIAEWTQMLQLDRETANSDLYWLEQHGVMYRVGRTSNVRYLIRPEYLKYFTEGGEAELSAMEAECIEPDAEKTVPVKLGSRPAYRERVMLHFTEMAARVPEYGVITRQKWMQACGLPKGVALCEINWLIEAGYLLRGGTRNNVHYEVIQTPQVSETGGNAPVATTFAPQPTYDSTKRMPIAAQGASMREAVSA